jgi:hypothetical protein
MKTTSRIVANIPKNDSSTIQAALCEFQGEIYVDLREYIESPGCTGPTKKGFRFHPENLEAFRRMIELVEKELDHRSS